MIVTNDQCASLATRRVSGSAEQCARAIHGWEHFIPADYIQRRLETAEAGELELVGWIARGSGHQEIATRVYVSLSEEEAASSARARADWQRRTDLIDAWGAGYARGRADAGASNEYRVAYTWPGDPDRPGVYTVDGTPGEILSSLADCGERIELLSAVRRLDRKGGKRV